MPCLVAFAAIVLAMPWLAHDERATDSDRSRDRAAPVPPGEASSIAAVAHDPLVGLWSAFRPGGDGEPVRFYYFHGDGHGLYRYGRVGATNTNSFDYAVDGDVVTLEFRKTGARHRVHFAIESGDHGRALVLDGDPKTGGRARYDLVRPDPVAPHEACAGAPVAGRMWMDRTGFATGGYGFGLYQLRCAGIDGRGTGWYHRGDFDDWTTESLIYRIAGDRLELQFATGSRLESTPFVVAGDDVRTLTLTADPRDFWHGHRYVDVGASFGSAALDFATPGSTLPADATAEFIPGQDTAASSPRAGEAVAGPPPSGRIAPRPSAFVDGS